MTCRTSPLSATKVLPFFLKPSGRRVSLIASSTTFTRSTELEAIVSPRRIRSAPGATQEGRRPQENPLRRHPSGLLPPRSRELGGPKVSHQFSPKSVSLGSI